MMAGSRSGVTGCFGYWPSTACWCSPQDHPQFSPFLPSSQLAQGGARAGHTGGPGAGLGRRYHLSASQERAAVPEPDDGCLLTQDSGPSRARRDARRIGALKQRCGGGELIHHSDRGVQYCSELYQSLHERYGVKRSMTDGYDCYQNALAERVNGILKGELLLQSPQDLTQVREAVDIYNEERPHHALKYRAPDAVHRAF